MGDINLVNSYALLAAILSVVYLAVIIPLQYKELRRPKNGFTRLRVRLFVQPILGLVLIATRIPFFISRIDAPTQSWGASIVAIATSTVLFFFIYNMYKSYTYKERSL